jgi:hypothetical protein
MNSFVTAMLTSKPAKPVDVEPGRYPPGESLRVINLLAIEVHVSRLGASCRLNDAAIKGND